MIPRVKPEGMLFGKRVPIIPDHARKFILRSASFSKERVATYRGRGIPAKLLDEAGRFPYLQRRDTSPQREAYYLEG
jgi:hypothetical protein